MSGVMDTTVGPASPGLIDAAVAVLRRGGLVAFPTDTVYGVGADPFDDSAVQRIFVAKGRPLAKPIPVLFADIASVKRVFGGLGDQAEKLAARFWPGALTLVLPAPEGFAHSVLAGGKTVGVRVPDHPIALALLKAYGPLAVTSANQSGSPSHRTAAGVVADLAGRVDLVIEGGDCPGGRESTVVVIDQSGLRVLRAGAINAETLEQVMAS